MNTTNSHTLAQVLQPRPCNLELRCVQPMAFEPGSLQEKVVTSAALKVRDLYANNQLRVAYDERCPEPFFDACYDTYSVALEVEQVVADDTTAAIAWSIFERAGWGRDRLKPTTLAGQVRMQVEAIEAAVKARQFFAKQAALC